jgi:hypothetical protein
MPSKNGRTPGPAGEGKGASILSISKSFFKCRDNLANCTVCTVLLLPEPWKARRVGLTLPLDPARVLGVDEVVIYVVLVASLEAIICCVLWLGFKEINEPAQYAEDFG